MENRRNVSDTAFLVGFNPEGQCVYSEETSLGDYYDEEHVWDSGETIKEVRLRKIHGYLFGSNGILEQEFESFFDIESGAYESGWARFADGTFRQDGKMLNKRL